MENKNGQGIFYGVIGVATLIVAIIGATFAYFSASTTGGAENLQGQTLGGTEGGVLSLTVEKIAFSSTDATSLDLVPTNITTANAQNAVTAKCESTSGVAGDSTKYTGCHLYRIVATAGSDIAGADLKLATFAPVATVKTDYNYAIWSTTDAATATTYTLGTNVSAATGSGEVASASPKTVFTSQAMTKNTPIVYYMLVWVADDNAVQNGGDDNDATGSYSGTLSLEASGGSTVKATFTA